MSEAVFNWALSNFNDAVISSNSDSNVFAQFNLNHIGYNYLQAASKTADTTTVSRFSNI